MSRISGSLSVDANIFSRWEVFDNFERDIEDLCAILEYRIELEVQLDSARLAIAHERMLAHKKAWLEHLLPGGTTQLSHLKMSAILIDALIDVGPISIGSAFSHARPSHPDETGVGQGDPPERVADEERKKFKDGGCHMVAWLLGYHICEFFESKRLDRHDGYESRITDEFEIDLVSGLLSGRVSAQSLHLILKALFLRD